jgi:hypothetical protein
MDSPTGQAVQALAWLVSYVTGRPRSRPRVPRRGLQFHDNIKLSLLVLESTSCLPLSRTSLSILQLGHISRLLPTGYGGHPMGYFEGTKLHPTPKTSGKPTEEEVEAMEQGITRISSWPSRLSNASRGRCRINWCSIGFHVFLFLQAETAANVRRSISLTDD